MGQYESEKMSVNKERSIEFPLCSGGSILYKSGTASSFFLGESHHARIHHTPSLPSKVHCHISFNYLHFLLWLGKCWFAFHWQYEGLGNTSPIQTLEQSTSKQSELSDVSWPFFNDFDIMFHMPGKPSDYETLSTITNVLINAFRLNVTKSYFNNTFLK